MKKVFRILLIIVVVLVVIVGILASYIALRSIPKYDVEKINVKVESTPARIERGLKLASLLCRNCHYNNATQKLTGKELKEAPQFGTIYSANITQDPIAGIGKWSDGDIIYLIRTGIKPDGQYIPPYMPKLIHISDEDLYSIVAFLRSSNNWVQADNTRKPASKPSFLTKFLVTIGAAKPFPYPKEKIPEPDTTNLEKWGKYISCYELECFSCHSRDFAKNDFYTPEKSKGFFGGGNEMYNEEGKKLVTLNITMDENTGIGKWTEEQFIKAVRTGQVPDGGPALRYPMQPYSNLTDQEVRAIYAYLKTVPKLDHKVERKFD
ncbi:MAG TPA: c-type cytochrome [Chitinophagaceae bacterium]|nr:c-type cytochrome [Chitinophagaceae bacterium]